MPIVPAAVIYDLVEGDPRRARTPPPATRPARRPRTGSLSAAASAPAPARRSARSSGASAAARPGSATQRRASGRGETVAAIAVVNAFGDVIAEDGTVLAGARGDDGETSRRPRP